MVARGSLGLQGVTGGYKRFRSGSKWLQGVLWGYKG